MSQENIPVEGTPENFTLSFPVLCVFAHSPLISAYSPLLLTLKALSSYTTTWKALSALGNRSKGYGSSGLPSYKWRHLDSWWGTALPLRSELEPRAGPAPPASGPGLHFSSWTAHGARSWDTALQKGEVIWWKYLRSNWRERLKRFGGTAVYLQWISGHWDKCWAEKNLVKSCSLEVGSRLLGAWANFLVLAVQKLVRCTQMK